MATAQLDGRPVIVSGGGDGTVRVWDLATGAPIGQPLTGHTGAVSRWRSPQLDGRPVVVSGSGDETVRVWDLATGAPVGDPLTGHTGAVYVGGDRAAGRPPGDRLRRRRQDGAGVGPGHRRPGRRPAHRPHRLGDVGGDWRSSTAAR